jgi:hypothetical protein
MTFDNQQKLIILKVATSGNNTRKSIRDWVKIAYGEDGDKYLSMLWECGYIRTNVWHLVNFTKKGVWLEQEVKKDSS